MKRQHPGSRDDEGGTPRDPALEIGQDSRKGVLPHDHGSDAIRMVEAEMGDAGRRGHDGAERYTRRLFSASCATSAV
jgi:hypothetical protein